MEINPKKIFSNCEINLPNVNKRKGKEEDKKSAEKKSKAPNNPTFYSNYYGIHKVSFGQTPKTDSERLEYLKQMKNSKGAPMFELSQFEPTEDGKESSLVKLAKNEKQFEFFRTMTSLKYDNGESVYNEKTINQFVDKALSFDPTGTEEFEMYGMKGCIKFDDDFGDFLQHLINEKNQNGEYIFNQDNMVMTLIVAYIFKPKDVSSEEMVNIFREINSENQKGSENKLSTNDIIGLTIAKIADPECKGMDIKKYLPRIKEYCNTQSELGTSEISAIIAAKVVMSDEDTQKTFEKLKKYKNSSGDLFFNAEDMLKIAKKFKGNEKVFELTDKLIEPKGNNNEGLFKPGVISYILQSDENAYKNALKICDETDNEKKIALANMYMAGEIIANDVLFERAQNVFNQKGKDGNIICDYISVLDIIKSENNYNNFIKYASKFAQYSVSNIPHLSKLTEKQCSQIEELLKLTETEDKKSYLWLLSLEKFVEDDETFELTKKLIDIKDKDNKPALEGYSLFCAFREGKEFAKRYLQAADLLNSTGIEITGSRLSDLAKNENLLKNAELFKGIKKENGKPILKYDELIKFSQLDSEKAGRIAQILKLKTSDGKYLEIPFHNFYLITDSTKEEFKNFLEYMPKMTELKDKNNQNVFSNVQETIECAKKGETAYKHAKILLDLRKENGEPLFNNYNIPKAIKIDGKLWNLLIKCATEKNSFGENVFSNDAVILSIINTNEITNKELFLTKSKAFSELRNPKDSTKRLLSDNGIYCSVKQDKDFTAKYKEYAPKLFELKNGKGNDIITQDNIHKFILDNDMSVDKLCHYINAFYNFKIDSNTMFFGEQGVVSAINKGEDYCNETINLLRQIADKKNANGTRYISSTKLNQLLGEGIEKIRTFNKNLNKLDEFQDYPYDNNICNIAELLASQSEEDLDKAIKFARYKDKNGVPFFTYQEVQLLTINPEYNRNRDIGVIQTLDKDIQDNLQGLINSVTDLKEKMMAKPLLYINGAYESEKEAAKAIDNFFANNKGKLMLMSSIFDKETIDNIMRKRLAISNEILGKLHGLNEKEQTLLKRLINSSNVDGKPFMASQKIQFIHLLNAYKTNGIETTEIEEMLEKGKVDIGKAELTLLRKILKKTDLTEEEITKIPPEKIYAWNNEYLHLLITDMKECIAMRDLFRNSLIGNFDEYIQSEDNIYGQTNNNTKNLFKEKGLNYNAWIKPNDALKVNFVSKDKNEEKLIQITKQIEEDIETLRRTPAKKFIDKQLSKYIKDDKFTVPTNIQTSKPMLKSFVNSTIDKLENVWERAKKNSENPDLKEKANNTLTVLDHLNQRIKDIDATPEVDASKNIDITIKMWERRPEKDIFQGNYSTCCIAIGNFNSSAMPHFVLNTAYNMIELTDNFTGKTIGNALCYFIKDKNGEPAYVIDNIEINNSNKTSDEIGRKIRDQMAEYASKVAKEVTGKENTPIYMSNQYNDVPTDDLKAETQEIEFIGDISADKIYMDLYGGWINKDQLKSTGHNLMRLR